MAADSPRERASGLTDRRGECAVLDRLVSAVRTGASRVLVVRGEPGVGKTVLLDYLVGQAAGSRVLRASGVQSEMELAFAGLHQLCTPMLDHLESLPVPQREALRTAFGISAGQAPDRFLVGLAVLGLLSEAAGERPLVCVIDDAQWLDRISAQVLGFVARRLAADPVALVFAARGGVEELSGLPELVVGGLLYTDARALLDSALTGPLDARVRDQLVAETGGNPLALLELPRGLTPAELAGFRLPDAVPLSGRIEESFRRQLEALPPQSRRLLQLAAADPTGDPSLVWRAAGRLGIPVQAALPVVEAELAEFGAHVRFRHPLARSAAYFSAPFRDRQGMHAALAEATDPVADPDRRAWHRAAAATGPDDEVAAELERSADRAQARGGLVAAAAFLERAVTLTVDPARRAGRTLAAARASLQAGAFGKALDLVASAEAGPLDESQGAQADWLRGQIAFASGPGGDAPSLLLKAASRLEPLDPELARETYLGAWYAAMFAGHLAGSGDLEEVSRAARSFRSSAHPPRPVDLLLDGLALWVADGPAVGAPVLREAATAFAGADIPAEEILRWGWMARVADRALWDDNGWSMTARQVEIAREAGALGQLPFLLNHMSLDAVWSGDLRGAASLIAEARAVCEATGSRFAPYGALMLASFLGRQANAAPLIQSAIEEDGTAGGQGLAMTYAHWAAAILGNGHANHEEALSAARQARDHAHLYVSMWTLPELIEAGVRTGNTPMAADALGWLAETTQAGGTEYGLGIEARSRALLSEAEAAEGHYREAIARLGRTRRRPDLARAHLLYGEWLRRERRRAEARAQLRTAYQMLDAMGMEAFAERARRELLATGETVAKRSSQARVRSAETEAVLTAQEAQVARLARDGLTNPEIAARLFISPRTVQYHLSKVFTKLDISSRGQLHRVLPGDQDPAVTRSKTSF